MAPRSVGMPALIAAAVLIALLLGGLSWRYFGPQGTGQVRPLTAQEKANQDWLQQKAKETEGDFSRLAPEDQRRLIAEKGQLAPFIFRQAARPVKVAQ